MRTFAIAAIMASLTMPTYAQDPSKEASNRAADVKKKRDAELEKAYKDAAKTNYKQLSKNRDPWASVRSASPAR